MCNLLNYVSRETLSSDLFSEKPLYYKPNRSFECYYGQAYPCPLYTYPQSYPQFLKKCLLIKDKPKGHQSDFYFVHPEGFEPPTTVPKTGVISISLRVHGTLLTFKVYIIKSY